VRRKEGRGESRRREKKEREEAGLQSVMCMGERESQETGGGMIGKH
jgi:hypothetical protein